MTNAVDESAIPEAFREPSQEKRSEQKLRRAKQDRDSVAGKANSGKKTTPSKKAAKSAKTAKTTNQAKEAKAGPSREGSKSARVLGLIQRTKGATLT
jgi:hypothetical protein